MENSPITAEEFSALMTDLGVPETEPFAVAVSGGGDSMALSLLAHNWNNNGHYLTFDHGLREFSGEEAEQVSIWMKDLGANHTVLKWEEEKPTSDIQGRARDGRYLALETYCIENDIPWLLLAHHRDDQAETFFMRLIRGSGVKGLCAMEKISSSKTTVSGPQIIRPLLDIPKERLILTLNDFDHGWIDDPSNENMTFLRIKVRKLLETNTIEGLNRDRLADTAKRMQRANDFLESEVQRFLSANVSSVNDGGESIDLVSFSKLPEEIALRALSRIFMDVGQVKYPPRLRKIENVYKECTQESFKGLTLAGCKMVPKKGLLIIRKEFERSEKS